MSDVRSSKVGRRVLLIRWPAKISNREYAPTSGSKRNRTIGETRNIWKDRDKGNGGELKLVWEQEQETEAYDDARN
jgi:hypothetical protein